MINNILKREINFARLITYIAIIIIILSIIILFIGARISKKEAMNDIVRQHTQQISKYIFQSLYSAMAKGWTKKEINEIISRLNQVEPDMKILVLRGLPVIGQFGEMPGEKELREKDPLIIKSLKGDESFVWSNSYVDYYRPIIVQKDCQKCHKVKEGDINGVIKISYPINNLNSSLSLFVNLGLISFVFFFIVIFLLFYSLVRLFIIKPILSLVRLMNEIITHADLGKRLPVTSKVAEILQLTDYFNKLLQSVQEYYHKLEEYAIVDPLTKLFNRRKFEEFIEYEVYRSSRHKHKFAIIMIDIDNLKYINDTYGHPVGDIVLKETANIIKHSLRKGDIAARIGGDEFSVALPETSINNGITVAEKTRKILADTTINIPGGGNVMLKASFGIAGYPDNGESMNDLLTASDVALYRAKHLGKDKVVALEEGEKGVMMDILPRGERGEIFKNSDR